METIKLLLNLIGYNLHLVMCYHDIIHRLFPVISDKSEREGVPPSLPPSLPPGRGEGGGREREREGEREGGGEGREGGREGERRERERERERHAEKQDNNIESMGKEVRQLTFSIKSVGVPS